MHFFQGIKEPHYFVFVWDFKLAPIELVLFITFIENQRLIDVLEVIFKSLILIKLLFMLSDLLLIVFDTLRCYFKRVFWILPKVGILHAFFLLEWKLPSRRIVPSRIALQLVECLLFHRNWNSRFLCLFWRLWLLCWCILIKCSLDDTFLIILLNTVHLENLFVCSSDCCFVSGCSSKFLGGQTIRNIKLRP